MEKAKELGLTQNEKNVKVVPGEWKKEISIPMGSLSITSFYGGLFFLLFTRMVTLQATGEAEGQALAAKAAAKYNKESAITANRGKY